MKRLTLSVMLVVAVVANTFACTNLIVGKNVSTDGSTIVPILPTPMDCLASCIIIPQACTRKAH